MGELLGVFGNIRPQIAFELETVFFSSDGSSLLGTGEKGEAINVDFFIIEESIFSPR